MKRKPKQTITITINGHEYDLSIPHLKRDAHLRFEDGAWVIDLFDSRKPTRTAHIETTVLEKAGDDATAPNWNEVFEWVLG